MGFCWQDSRGVCNRGVGTDGGIVLVNRRWCFSAGHSQGAPGTVTGWWFEPFVTMAEYSMASSRDSEFSGRGDRSVAGVALLRLEFSSSCIQIFKLVLPSLLQILCLHCFTIASGICASQIYVACQNGRVDEALSLGFLLCWRAGDLTSFVGCYLTNQLPIQVICRCPFFLSYFSIF